MRLRKSLNRLNDLLNSLCRNGVTFRPLNDLSISLRKDTLTTDKLIEDGKYPVINSGRTFYGFYNDYNNEGNAVTVAARGEYAAFVNYSPTRFWAGGLCYPLRSSNEETIRTKFIYYYLKKIEKYMRNTLVAEGGIPALNKADLMKIKIPVPPICVQDEIIHILDSFSDLSSKLSSELDLRKKQYYYYKQKLILDNDGESFSLDELCEISAGGDAPKDNMSLEKTEKFQIPIISNGVGENAFYGYTNFSKIDEPCITIAARGTIGYAEFRDYPFVPIVRLLCVIPKDSNVLNTKYLYYCLEGKQYPVPISGIPQLTAPMLKREIITIPSIQEQIRIVDLLDKFNAICNDKNRGLPAEIEIRQKQFEYYLDLLLSFEEAK